MRRVESYSTRLTRATRTWLDNEREHVEPAALWIGPHFLDERAELGLLHEVRVGGGGRGLVQAVVRVGLDQVLDLGREDVTDHGVDRRHVAERQHLLQHALVGRHEQVDVREQLAQLLHRDEAAHAERNDELAYLRRDHHQMAGEWRRTRASERAGECVR